MSSVCPLLKKIEGGYICGAVNRSVNPEAWYCFMDYYSCPFYIAYVRRQATRAAETSGTVTAEVKPMIEVTQQVQVQQAPPQPISEPEDEIISKLRSMLASLESKVNELDNMWKEYESKAASAKAELDKNEYLISQYIASLEGIKANLEESSKELEYKRGVNMIDEESYNKAKEHIDKRLSNLNQQLGNLKDLLSKVESAVLAHYKRVLTESAEAAKIKLSLAKLEELYRSGKVSKEVYERLKAQLTALGG